MLTTLTRAPAGVLHLASRGASKSLRMAGGLSATLFPGLLLPADRVALVAWATAYASDTTDPRW
jgi:hypothetical protein